MQKKGIRNLICSSFQDLEWTDEKLENAALFDVLEHIDKDIDFLQNLGSHLKMGGLLFLTVPSYNVLFSTEDEHDGHFRRYSSTKIKEILSLTWF